MCGAAGSAWKMYISPIHAVMVLHNVETNEEIWDYKATDADLLRVVEGNIVGLGGIAAKARAAKERELEWEKLTRDRSAGFFFRSLLGETSEFLLFLVFLPFCVLFCGGLTFCFFVLFWKTRL